MSPNLTQLTLRPPSCAQRAYADKPELEAVLKVVGKVKSNEDKTNAEKIAGAREVLVQMQTARVDKLAALLNAALAELE